MIYDYDRKEKILKINDRTVLLTDKESKVLNEIIVLDDDTLDLILIPTKLKTINELLYDGYGTKTQVRSFISKLSNKIGEEIKVK